MKKRLIAIAALIGLASVAWAQPANDEFPSDGRFRADFKLRPTGRDFEQNYPHDALRKSIIGAADLCCTPLPDRTLSCSVGFDWPKDHGFGEASVKIAKRFVMTEASYQEFKSDPSNWLQVPVRFLIGNRSKKQSEEIDKIFTTLRETSLGLCKGSRPVS